MGQHTGSQYGQAMGRVEPPPPPEVEAASRYLGTAPEAADFVRAMIQATVRGTAPVKIANSSYSGVRTLIRLHCVQEQGGGFEAPPVPLAASRHIAQPPVEPSRLLEIEQKRAELAAELAALEAEQQRLSAGTA